MGLSPTSQTIRFPVGGKGDGDRELAKHSWVFCFWISIPLGISCDCLFSQQRKPSGFQIDLAVLELERHLPSGPEQNLGFSLNHLSDEALAFQDPSEACPTGKGS